MKFRRLKAIAVKEVLQIWRDPRSLLIALLLPFTQMFLLGYGVNLDLKHVPVCTFDREGSELSQALLKHFQASPYFAIARNVASYAELVAAIDKADCKVAIVVPPDFSERLNDTGNASVQAGHPADLYTFHKMQRISFSLPAGLAIVVSSGD